MFSGFQIFSDIGKYVNTEKIGGLLGGGGFGSFGSIVADQFFGAVSGPVSTLIRKLGLGGYGFIVDTITKERLVFQYNVDAKEQGGAEYTKQSTLARSVPQYQYKGGKDRVLTLPITFTMQTATRDDVRRSVRWLEALAYPDYNGSEIAQGPHPVLVVQGKLYMKDLWLVQDFAVEWGQARDPITQLPSEATVNLTLIEVSSRGKSPSDMLFL